MKNTASRLQHIDINLELNGIITVKRMLLSQGLRVEKVEAFPHGRVTKYAIDAEKPLEIAVQFRVDPVPTGIGVKVEERGKFPLEHRQCRQQAVHECQPAAGDRILKVCETFGDRFHNCSCTQAAAQPPRLFRFWHCCCSLL